MTVDDPVDDQVSDLPWLTPLKQQLATRREAGRLPHALLIVGGAGVGAEQMVSWLEHHLLCSAPPQQAPCGQCRSCQLLAAGNHADTLRLVPEGKAGTIRVDAIRHALHFAQGTPQLSQHQLVVLEQAHSLNLAAANALLKMLEEPPSGTFLILQTPDPSRLLPTVRSRVQWVRCPVPSAEQALPWLENQLKAKQMAPDQATVLLRLADGEPCTALAMADPASLAERQRWIQALIGQIEQPTRALDGLADLANVDPQAMLSAWQQWLVDINRLAQTDNPDWVRHQDQLDTMTRLLSRLPAHSFWLGLYDQVQAMQQDLQVGNNLNWQLLLETFWLRILRDVRQQQGRN